MSPEADRKSALSDPLLILISLLLLLAAAAALYFAVRGPAKEYAQEPGARPRPVITNQVVVVNVQEVVAKAAPAGTEHATETKPAAETAKTPESSAAAPPAVITVNPPKVTATTDGKIRGKVILKGTPPPETVIGALKADAKCGAVAVGTARTRGYVVGTAGALKNTVVRIVKAPTGAGKMPESAVIDQAGCMYEPYVSAVMVGEPFKVKNSDPFMHNVNATPKINKGFNFAQATAGQVNEKVFDKPELAVRFSCNVHPWMFAFVYVLENPFFAVTDAEGAFEIPPGLPPGTYELEANHQRAGAVKQSIEVGPGKGAVVLFELGVPVK
ncbi:MAG TPA: carboxypeptidase regulatory-like domain-containing protein [Verrucomicrobiota bacterium]|nr:carboxypeptidase regulatory-like domain-containing protein [Verrucomicrobiota bacterium]